MEDVFGEGVEIQVFDISCNMAILMVDLESDFGAFGEFGGSNSKIISEGKLGDKQT